MRAFSHIESILLNNPFLRFIISKNRITEKKNTRHFYTTGAIKNSVACVFILQAAPVCVKELEDNLPVLFYQIIYKELRKGFVGHRNDQENFATPVVEQVLEPDPFIHYESLRFMSVS